LAWHRCAAAILRRSHFADPSTLADVINQAAGEVGAAVSVHLVDREQLALRALPRSGVTNPEPLPIEGTLAGRCFTTQQVVTPPGQPGSLWIPIVDGSDRLGAVEIALTGHDAEQPEVRDGAELLASVIGYVIVAKSGYGDVIRRARRSRPMSTEGELLWRALPPLTFATGQVRLAAALEPCYEVGGDAFDYAMDHGVLRLGIFDAVGHGLSAALTSTLTLAATRAARTAGLDLPALAAAADDAITGQFRDTRYTTAILAELDSASGVVRYLNAGHPPACLIRGGRVVATLDQSLRPPLGVPAAAEVAGYELEPGDRLLFYTDGIVEARSTDGEFFGLARLLDLAERHASSGLTAAEVLRRLSLAVLDHQGGRLDDDATLMLVEWSPGSAGPRAGPSGGASRGASRGGSVRPDSPAAPAAR
jgi:hypothetical protein